MIYIQITNCEAPKRAISESELFWERGGLYPGYEGSSDRQKTRFAEDKKNKMVPFELPVAELVPEPEKKSRPVIKRQGGPVIKRQKKSTRKPVAINPSAQRKRCCYKTKNTKGATSIPRFAPSVK